MYSIGIFDSGYGGLTVFKEIAAQLPQYDYIYLGDNARSPYGTRSFETIYDYTWQCVQQLFNMDCHLVILACNTASAKALRNIQQLNLPKFGDNRRVLGVIRPTAEVIGNYSKTQKVGILATEGTIKSNSYVMEIKNQFPSCEIFQQSCPMWVPLIENNEQDSAGADYFVKKYLKQLLNQSKDIDTLLLACTHYPLLLPKIKEHVPKHIKVIEQGNIVAQSLADYLQRHQEIEQQCSKNNKRTFFTTENPQNFNEKATLFVGYKIEATQLHIS
ncbi:MAG: glutamate racemase [Bacteroidota bacterium]|jgi:glutamate racemase